MCAQSSSRDMFDRLASEYDELKLRVIPGYRQVPSGFPTCSRIIANTTSLNPHRHSCRTCEQPGLRQRG
jgi:hypothetical protein